LYLKAETEDGQEEKETTEMEEWCWRKNKGKAKD